MSTNIGEDFSNLRAHWDAAAATQPVYPTPQEALLLKMMGTARNDLLNLGWQDIIYCPKDGTRFLCVVASGHVGPCVYMGEWPKGGWWMEDAGDLWPVHPTLWKPLSEPKDSP